MVNFVEGRSRRHALLKKQNALLSRATGAQHSFVAES